MKICTEQDCLRAHLTLIKKAPRGLNPILRKLKQSFRVEADYGEVLSRKTIGGPTHNDPAYRTSRDPEGPDTETIQKTLAVSVSLGKRCSTGLA